MAEYNNESQAAPGTPPQEDEEAIQAAAEERQIHEEAAEKRTASGYDASKSVEDAEKDYEEAAQAYAEASSRLAAAEGALPELRIRAQQAKVDELKEQEVQYSDDGRLLGAPIGNVETDDDPVKPVANPQMYGGNPDPKTLRYVH